jgi:hypothetical protein
MNLEEKLKEKSKPIIYWQRLDTGDCYLKETDALKLLKDYQDEIDETLDEVSKVYFSITNGKFSKPNQCSQVILDEYNETILKDIEEEIKNQDLYSKEEVEKLLKKQREEGILNHQNLL